MLVYYLDVKFSITTPADFSLVQCLNAHGWPSLSPFTWSSQTATLTRTQELETGRIISLTITEPSDGIILATLTDDVDVDTIEPVVRRMLQLDLDLASFHAYCHGRSELQHIPERRLGRMLRSPTLWEDVVKVICTTNTTWTQTKAMVSRIVDGFGIALANTENRTFPSPQQIAAVPCDDFAATARLGYRNAAVHKIATMVTNSELDLESWQDPCIPSADLRKRLLSLPGIGPYATACLMLYLGRSEHVNVDSWARTLVGKELGRAVTDKEVLTFFAQYGEWQGYVYSFYNWKTDAESL